MYAQNVYKRLWYSVLWWCVEYSIGMETVAAAAALVTPAAGWHSRAQITQTSLSRALARCM